jgi:hypothetical protein
MESHMRQLIKGEWNSKDYSLATSNDFKDLSMTYDYLLHTLKTMTEVELESLSRMRLDPNDKEAYTAWIDLINIKRKRLGLESINVTYVESDVKPSLRRAS